ncbi:hypothetical protein B0T17DRAFT_658526 [Bombardia bombarda]|uniref:Uncharacterized protein n=1 Tax=Bombardia bombarda TaxID=252184 RepID=A0AA39WBI4_9PEZI|nr:hypothetical protein B0T17DRAFT_658526 [Bombardia bombarda]
MAHDSATGLGEALYSPKDAKVDIIFVHGLGGHRVKTWKSRANEDEPVEKFWPEDFLKTACPTARILSFGYEATFQNFYPYTGPQNIPVGTTIDDHSASLFLAINNFHHSTKTPPGRPLIFVTHSLGGLVVANALSRPHTTSDADTSLVDSTIGIVFFGTPFEGSSKAKWGVRALKFLEVFGATSPANMHDLQERSQRLTLINDNFGKLIKARDQSQTTLNIACLFEVRETYVKKALKWTSIGVIVPKDSATLSGITPIPVEANHSGMCKFATESRDGYKSVSGILSRWIKALDATSAKRGAGIIHDGDMNFHGTVNNSGIVARDIDGYTPDAVRLTGSVNYYGSDYKPPQQSP